jgi:hypothetical protein
MIIGNAAGPRPHQAQRAPTNPVSYLEDRHELLSRLAKMYCAKDATVPRSLRQHGVQAQKSRVQSGEGLPTFSNWNWLGTEMSEISVIGNFMSG